MLRVACDVYDTLVREARFLPKCVTGLITRGAWWFVFSLVCWSRYRVSCMLMFPRARAGWWSVALVVIWLDTVIGPVGVALFVVGVVGFNVCVTVALHGVVIRELLLRAGHFRVFFLMLVALQHW